MEQLAKNQLHTAEITGYTSEGAGVCHIAGRAVFVKGALVGETWQVRILKVTANAVYGKAEQCLSPAAARTEPPCPVYRTCGGCSLQHMDYGEQLRMKRARVNDALTRIGGVSTPVQDIIGMEYPLCYRNKAIYAVGMKDGRVVKGFYRAASSSAGAGASSRCASGSTGCGSVPNSCSMRVTRKAARVGVPLPSKSG